jgi:serine/threonine protein kinase
MGEVFMAQDERLRNFVAVKELLLDSDHARAAFTREAELLVNLRHPGLPRVTDRFTEDGRQYLVMDWVDGQDLSETLTGEPWPVGAVWWCADEALAVLSYLHRNRPPIIHRDIKPANIKLTPGKGRQRGRIMLLDFGLAKGAAGQMTTGQAFQSMPGMTHAYAPLEQATGQGTDERSDLFSLAATIFHLLVREPPPSVTRRAGEMALGRPDPLRLASDLDGQVPVPVAEVLHEALALDPERRPADAAAMRRRMRAAAREARLTLRPPSRPDSTGGTGGAAQAPTLVNSDVTTRLRREEPGGTAPRETGAARRRGAGESGSARGDTTELPPSRRDG